jgi:hypothetical protein
MKIATITMNLETYLVTVKFSKEYQEEDWRVKADALSDLLRVLFDEYDTVLRREIEY